MSAADIEPGETYTVTVTPRNKNNVLSPPKDFSVTVPKDNAGGHALIKLNKIAERIDVPVSANTPASTADYWETPVKTKEIKYTVTAANTGDGKAKNFIITDLIAAGLNFEVGSLAVVSDANDPNDIVNASFDPTTNVITASISELEPNESFAVSFVVTPAADAPSKVKNKARASWEE